MDRRERGNTSPREILEALLPKSLVDERVDVLTHAATLEDLTREFHARDFTCDREQFLFPLFRPLYEQFPKVQEATLAELESTGLSRELLHQYLTAMGNQPHVILALTHGQQVPADARVRLMEETQRVMFEALRRQLGIVTVAEAPTT